MDTSIFNCCDSCSCNNTDDISSILSSSNCNCNNSQNNSSNSDCVNPVNRTLQKLENDLCDMRVLSAETRANLVFLAQTMCSTGCINDTEKLLLLNLEKQVKEMNCRIRESKCNVERLECLLN